TSWLAQAALASQLVAEAPQETDTASIPVKRIRLPAIPAEPWPPALASNIATTPQPAGPSSADKARTRLVRVQVAASRSRAEAESLEPGPHAAPPEPSTWLGQIEKLRSEGHTAEAEQ